MRTNKSSLHAPCCARASKTMAAAEDDVLKKLRRAAASGVGASGSLSAQRVQTVLRHAREVLLSYERSHGTDDFLNATFKACDMKCFEFEVNRFSSGVLGVDTTSCAIDDDDEGPSEEIKELVARKHWLRLQDWEYNDAVLTAKTAPITTMLCRLDPDSSLDLEEIRFYQATHDFYFKQYRAFRKRCNEELVRIEGELEPFEELPDVDDCGLIDLDGNKVGRAALEILDGGKYRVKLILKDPVAGVDIRGIGPGVADINRDGTVKVTPPSRPQTKRLGDHPKPRGRAPLKKSGEPAVWCFETGTWINFLPIKLPKCWRITSIPRMGGLL